MFNPCSPLVLSVAAASAVFIVDEMPADHHKYESKLHSCAGKIASHTTVFRSIFDTTRVVLELFQLRAGFVLEWLLLSSDSAAGLNQK